MGLHHPGMQPTLDAVARRSGCSPATVSRVINRSASVSPAVRAKVELAIRELGYLTRRPLQPGGELICEVIVHRSGTMEHVAVQAGGLEVLGPPEEANAECFFTEPWRLGNEFYLRILNGILAELRSRGGKALIQPISDLQDVSLLHGSEAGPMPVLLVGDGGRFLTSDLAHCRRPMVLVDMPDVAPGYESVSSNNILGIGLALDHLAGLGHRRCGFVGTIGPGDGCERTQAFAMHAMRLGLEVVPGWERVPYDDIRATTARVAGLLAAGPRPTALVCANDYAALAALRAARQAGIAVPRGLSLVGYDDITLAARFDPPLTSLQVDCEEIGRMSVRMLLSQAPGRTGPGCCVRIPPRLVVRASTAPPPA